MEWRGSWIEVQLRYLERYLPLRLHIERTCNEGRRGDTFRLWVATKHRVAFSSHTRPAMNYDPNSSLAETRSKNPRLS